MPRCLLILLACLLLLLRGSLVQAAVWDEPSFENVGDADSIPDNNVTALAEGRDGLLWIGTPNGLLRYDGYRFRRYTHDAEDPFSLGGVFVRSLLVAGDGRVWIGTDADGVSVFDPQHGRFAVYRRREGEANGVSDNHVRALAGDQDGGVYIGTRGGLDYWDPRTQTIVPLRVHPQAPAPVDEDRVLGLCLDRRGDLWVGSWNGLSRLRAGQRRFERIHSDVAAGKAPLAAQSIAGLLELQDGRIAIGTASAGHFLLDPSTLELQPVPSRRETGAGVNDVVALKIMQLRSDQVWIAGLGGIDVLDPVSGRLLRAIRNDPAVPSTLGHTDVRAALVDRAGIVWVGGYSGGLQRHYPANTAIRVLRYRAGDARAIANPSVSSVVELPDGRLAIGTRGGGIDVLDREIGVVEHFSPRPGVIGALGNGIVTALEVGADGALWAGTDAGLYRLDPLNRQFRYYGVTEGLPRNNVRRLLADRDGVLWIGTDSGVGRLRPGAERIDALSLADGSPVREDVNAFAEDRAGRLWVGGTANFYTLEPGADRLQPVQRGSDRFGSLKVVGLLFDHQGQIWVDTPEGLYRGRIDAAQNEFEAISARLGIAGQPFGANLLEDAEGRIWSPHFVYDPRLDQAYSLTRADGVDIGTSWFRSYARSRDGLFLFGGSKGLLVVDPTRFRPRPFNPALVATELKIGGRIQAAALSPGQLLVLDAKQRSFSVEFAALDFSAPERLSYRYQLQGFDPDWIATDAAHRIAAYTNLWPGEYRLRVAGTDRNGHWSEQVLELPVRVLPAWWQTWWFAVFVVLGFALAIRQAFRWRLARSRARQRELQALVAVRTAELSTAKQYAENALVQLQGAQKQLVEAEKMASLGQLVAGVAHEINTPLGVAMTASSMLSESSAELQRQFASGQIKRSDLENFLSVTENASKLVDTNLARAAKLVRSFKEVAVDRGADERRWFDLRECLDSVVSGLEPGCERRGIRLVLDCAEGLRLDSYPGTLGQIITQFVQNALLHAYDEGQSGCLRIEASRLPDNHIALRFCDDGKGVSSEDLPHVFEPFFTTKRARGGTGLGLHIVFNLVTQRLGGEIEVSPLQPQGTCFNLRLPRSAPVGH